MLELGSSRLVTAICIVHVLWLLHYWIFRLDLLRSQAEVGLKLCPLVSLLTCGLWGGMLCYRVPAQAPSLRERRLRTYKG